MDWNTPDLNSWPAKLVMSVGRKIRSSRSYREEAIRKQDEKNAKRLHKAAERNGAKYGWHKYSLDANSFQEDVNELGERKYSQFSQASTLVNNIDHTDMIHTLTHQESLESLVEKVKRQQIDGTLLDLQDAEAIALARALSDKHMRPLASLPEDVWTRIASYLKPADAAALAVSSLVISQKLGAAPFLQLELPENRAQKIEFLHRLDKHYPEHLLCFQCAKYHRRSSVGQETLKADYVSNPLFKCPSVRMTFLPRTRLVHGRYLPYSFVQLPLRAERHRSVSYGVPAESLSRRWKAKDNDWSHRTRYIVHEDRLLLRVVSQAFTVPAAEMTETSMRHLLYDREEYTPFFSVCAHWRDGDLMKVCKCALSHVPSPPISYLQQLKKGPQLNRALAQPAFMVRGCDFCSPARRCPECPTEYLVELQFLEDKTDPVRKFKHAIVVTRWSDLGDGSSPYTSPEWVAVNGLPTEQVYQSFSHVGRRAVGGIFESRVSGSVPGQRLISLNPNNVKLGEDGHGWY